MRWTLLLLVACTIPEDPVGRDPGDPGDPGDTDVDPDTDPVSPSPASIEVRWGGEIYSRDWRLAARRYDTDDEGPMGLTEVGAAGSWRFEAPTTWVTLDAPADPDRLDRDTGLEGAIYLLYAFLDRDHDRAQGDDEPVVGLPRPFVIYVSTAGTSGLPAGFSVFDDGDALPIDVGLDLEPFAYRSAVVFGGRVGDVEAERLTSVSAIESGPLVLEEALFDVPLEEPFRVELTAAPPPGRVFEDATLPGALMAAERIVAYTDRNHDGYTDGEEEAEAWLGRWRATLLWLAPIADPLVARMAVGLGFQPGWQLGTPGRGGFEVATPEQARNLVLR